jgi:hypothetical protein
MERPDQSLAQCRPQLSSRLQTQSGPPDDDGCEHDGGEVGCELVIAGCDASPIFEAAEHAFDEIALAIGNLVERMIFFRVGLFGMIGIVPRSRRNRRSPSLS